MGLIIFSIIEFFVIIVIGTIAAWQVMRYRGKAAAAREETAAFKRLLVGYEDEKYKQMKQVKAKKPDKGTRMAAR